MPKPSTTVLRKFGEFKARRSLQSLSSDGRVHIAVARMLCSLDWFLSAMAIDPRSLSFANMRPWLPTVWSLS